MHDPQRALREGAGTRPAGRRLGTFAAFVALAAALMTCSVDDVRFAPEAPEVREDCAAAGDEDGNGAADCADPACAEEAACQPTCSDGQRNGDESAVDCGGSCPACADAASCGSDGDCASGLCGAGSCVRLASCQAILAAGLSRGDGLYSVDFDGAESGAPLQVKCDMTVDGGGFTRFHWVTGAYPGNVDPFEQQLSQCAPADPICRGRIPETAEPTDFLIKDLGDGDVAAWKFDSGAVATTALAAFRNHRQGCVLNQPAWQPYLYTGTEAFCGTGGEGGCRAFVYTNIVGCGNSYAGWYSQLDGDTGCYNTAFKLGMTHAGYESIGCEMPDANYLDDGPTTADDRTGELYYR